MVPYSKNVFAMNKQAKIMFLDITADWDDEQVSVFEKLVTRATVHNTRTLRAPSGPFPDGKPFFQIGKLVGSVSEMCLF
jgi:hypothetical protein